MKNQESKESMIMKLKKFIAILSVATMTAGLAVGCGSSSDSGSSDSSSADSKSSDWDSSNDITIVSSQSGCRSCKGKGLKG